MDECIIKQMNGRADKKGFKEEDADPKELEMGIVVEAEHTDDPAIAKKIALDHLAECSNYYTRLAEMEKECNASKNKVESIKESTISLHLVNDVAEVKYIAATPHIAGGIISYKSKKGWSSNMDFIDIRDLPEIAKKLNVSVISLAGNWTNFGKKGFGEEISVEEFENLIKQFDIKKENAGPLGGIGVGKNPSLDFKEDSPLIKKLAHYDDKGGKFSEYIDKFLEDREITYLSELSEEDQEELLMNLKKLANTESLKENSLFGEIVKQIKSVSKWSDVQKILDNNGIKDPADIEQAKKIFSGKEALFKGTIVKNGPDEYVIIDSNNKQRGNTYKTIEDAKKDAKLLSIQLEEALTTSNSGSLSVKALSKNKNRNKIRKVIKELGYEFGKK